MTEAVWLASRKRFKAAFRFARAKKSDRRIRVRARGAEAREEARRVCTSKPIHWKASAERVCTSKPIHWKASAEIPNLPSVRWNCLMRPNRSWHIGYKSRASWYVSQRGFGSAVSLHCWDGPPLRMDQSAMLRLRSV